MIIFISYGRLGNQLFQYAFLQTIRKENEKIIVFGFDELIDVFEGFENILIIPFAMNIKSNNMVKKIVRAMNLRFVFKFLRPFLRFLSSIGLISSIKVEYDYVFGIYRREKTSFNEKIGFFKNIRFVDEGYFQSEKFFKSEKIKKLRIKDKYILKAQEVLSIIPNNFQKVAIHIRRGDFKTFTVYGLPTLLPVEYYHHLINWCYKNIKNSFFIFISDEPEFVKKNFSYIEDKIISNENYGVDFAILTMCDYAIISPSSFAWWGLNFNKNKKKAFAPKYWLGFNSNVEYHIKSFPSFCDSIDVSKLRLQFKSVAEDDLA